MLRIHFTDRDLARIRVAAHPDPLWEIATSLHRFQSRRGRWAFAAWHRVSRARLRERRLDRVLRTGLLPLFPRAAYYPDFLNPAESAEGLGPGLEAILATPPHRVLHEMSILDRRVGAPSWAPRLADTETRKELVEAIRGYHEAVIAPHTDQMQARFEADRSARCRGLLDGGVEGMLAGLAPTMRWRSPVLYVDYPAAERDLCLNGRGLVLVPSYFCWHTPIGLADPTLSPVLVYPILHRPAAAPESLPASPQAEALPDGSVPAPLSTLLGRTRATVLCVTATGATTGEIARAAGVSSSSASKHTTALRDAGLIISIRHATSVLHTLTPAGVSVLRATRR
ncbi:ArsR family transcriptional regulator [Streptomyces sp. NPDC005374]|uniref:ArsR family transcriptional regulator n=1 Tax=Streptomyces sp. NPDC005374 TaxID=3364713 RepID=UPI0036802864